MENPRNHRNPAKNVNRHNNEGTPSNKNLTPEQVAQALENFKEAITTTEAALKERVFPAGRRDS